MDMAAGNEIKRLRTLAGISADKAARLIGVNADRLRKWEQRDADPKEMDTVRVEEYFGRPIIELEKLDKWDWVAKPYDRQVVKNSAEPAAIPIFEDAPFTLTNTMSYRDVPIDEPNFWVTIPGLKKCNFGCRATGDSMHPLIRSHALVVGEEITDKSFLLYGEIYIVITTNGHETIKYIHPCDTNDECLLLVPYNEKAKTTPILKKDIFKLYKAKAVFNVL